MSLSGLLEFEKSSILSSELVAESSCGMKVLSEESDEGSSPKEGMMVGYDEGTFARHDMA